MERHPFDPVSALLGVLAVTFGVLVMAGAAFDLEPREGWWIAVAAALVGLVILPWRRPSRSPAAPEPPEAEPSDDTAAS